MTTQQKLQAVTEQIRKDIPRLMELSEGCTLVYKENEIAYKIIDRIGKLIFIANNKQNVSVHEVDIKDLFEIVGHEPMLNDLLEWVNERPKNFRKLLIDSDGLIYKFAMNGTLEWLQDVKWDLSKPYLKDQSDKLKEFLYNLKNK